MFSKEVLKIVKRLQASRLSLMRKQPFYAVLLLHMQFSLDPMCETAYTDGSRIVFCPDFIDSLSDEELEFVLMHEVLHAALNHCNRKSDSYDFDDFNTACDIVVNSNILYSFDMDLSKITLKNYGESMHIAPDGKEGYEYSAEEVYKLVHSCNETEKKKNNPMNSGNDEGGSDEGGGGEGDSDEGDSDEGGSGEGDSDEGGSGDGDSDEGGSGEGGTGPARFDGGFDDHTYWGMGDTGSPGQSCNEYGEEYESNHCSAYNKSETDDGYSKDIWLQRMIEATTIANRIISIKDSHEGYGGPPLMAQRILMELTEPQTDWREVLQDFVQEEINDYSFNPPDRRFQDSMFLLPDFNEKESGVKNIWFLIDTSGSIGDNAIRAAYSEICAAIDQFNGKLEGWLSFTESYVTVPIPFSSVEDVMEIKPVGGGGNDFSAIFRYMNENMTDEPPAYIIIITDGYDEFPAESEAGGIPVLWLINNEDRNPPWGKIGRIKVDE